MTIGFRRKFYWDDEAARLAIMLSPPQEPYAISHLGVVALVGAAADRTMEEAGAAAAAGGNPILGRGGSAGTRVILIEDSDPAEAAWFLGVEARGTTEV